ncbi:MAG TPA: hypothetical protein VJ505_04725 [Holophagaceae bacterium]|nr:hypothetical protein [Holophagaceae bacterium]
MTQLIYACERNPAGDFLETLVSGVADRVAPEVEGIGAHRMERSPGERLCLVRPAEAGQSRALQPGVAGLVGVLTQGDTTWSQLGETAPEGSFALVRSTADHVELRTDFTGSRSLWYAFDAQHLFASTSLRALMALLPGRQLDRSALAWFLSTGSLGLEAAWDQRIRRVPADGRVRLDRDRWTLETTSNPVVFAAEAAPREVWRARLQAATEHAIQTSDVFRDGWILPLSGGLDSRMLLVSLLAQGHRPRTVTWGQAASQAQPGNDAWVASKLALHFGLPHEYRLTEKGSGSAESMVDAFLATHGGTTDSIPSYLDGMAMWREFAREGVQGIIRGDQGFGFTPRPAKLAQYAVGLLVAQEFLPREQVLALGEGLPEIPDLLQQQPGESEGTYMDRLYHAFRMPIGLAALNDVKAPFVEIANPMLFRSVQSLIRALPDDLRFDRSLHREIVESVSPAIPFASVSADDNDWIFLHAPAFESWMRQELAGDACGWLLPEGLRQDLIGSLNGAPSVAGPAQRLRSLVKRVLPDAWVNALRARMPPWRPPMRLFAFRAALAGRLMGQWERDQRALQGSWNQARPGGFQA